MRVSLVAGEVQVHPVEWLPLAHVQTKFIDFEKFVPRIAIWHGPTSIRLRSIPVQRNKAIAIAFGSKVKVECSEWMNDSQRTPIDRCRRGIR
jgi:hypothetical protein